MTGPQQGPGWSIRQEGARAVIALSGDWIAPASETVIAALDRLFDATPKPRAIAFDATGLGRWDSALIAFLWQVRTQADAQAITVEDAALPGAAQRLLGLVKGAGAASKAVPKAGPRHRAVLAVIGGGAIARWTQLAAAATLLGEMTLSLAGAGRGRAKMRLVDLATCLRDAGASAVLIVTVVNFLVGAILAFVGVVQLRRFGAGIYVANLVGIAMVREMAAVVTAVVMAGRTGGAYAAEIATMQGNEEIDALRVVGIPVQDYLILPRMIALTTMLPILYLYGSAIGLIGGFTVAVSMLDMTSDAYVIQTRAAISGTQFVIGFTKSIAFGALVAFIGCMIGLRAGRSAADVGRASTAAVVAGIVGVIVVDAVFAVCLNAVGR